MNNNFQLKTAVPGILWPAIPSASGATTLSLLRQLEQSQWMSAEAIRKQQFKQLDALLKHAFKYSNYYRQQLEEFGYDDSKPLNEDLWSTIPILTRDTLQKKPEEIRCSSYPRSHGEIVEMTSSGSTGKPVTVYRTMLTKAFYDAYNLLNDMWYERDYSARRAIIRQVKAVHGANYPEGIQQHSWGSAAGSIFKTGDAWLLRIDTPVRQQVEWLIRLNPSYILTYPTNLHALVKEFDRQNKKLGRLREIVTISEPLSEDTKKYCEEYFSVPVADLYSCQEIGALASHCPDHPSNYHVHSEHVFMEILDDQNRLCRPGESGRVVLTSTHNFAMPLIRYEIGDYAEVGNECGCGRGLPVIKKILGRQRNLLTLPNGDQFWPLFGMLKYSELTGKDISQAQLIQKDLQHLDLKLVMDGTLNADQENKIVEFIQDNVHHKFDILISYCDEIPRARSGKFEEFMSLIEPAIS